MDLRNIVTSPNRMMGPPRTAATNDTASSASGAATGAPQPPAPGSPSHQEATVSQAAQTVPSTPPQRNVPHAGNRTSEGHLRALVLTPPRPTKPTHKRDTSYDIDQLWEAEGSSRRPVPLEHSTGLLPPFSPLRSAIDNNVRANMTPALPAETARSSEPGSVSQSSHAEKAQQLPKEKSLEKTAYTWDQVDPHTDVDKHFSPLNTVFTDIEPEELQLKDMFPGRDQEKLKFVATKLNAVFYPNTQKLNTRRAVVFESHVGNGLMIVETAYKAPEFALTKFHPSKAFKLHFEKAGFTEKPEFLVQRKIQSKDGVAFLKELTEEQGLKPGDELNAAQLKKYMDKVSNGKLSGHILDDMELTYESARLLAEYKIQDDDESEEASSEEDEGDNVSRASSENDLPFHYSIVLKTSPSDKPHASPKTVPAGQVEGTE